MGEDHKCVYWENMNHRTINSWELGVLGSKLNSPGSSQGFLHHYMNIVYFMYCSRLDRVKTEQWPEFKRKSVCAVEVRWVISAWLCSQKKSLKNFIGKIGISDIKWSPVLVFKVQMCLYFNFIFFFKIRKLSFIVAAFNSFSNKYVWYYSSAQ